MSNETPFWRLLRLRTRIHPRARVAVELPCASVIIAKRLVRELGYGIVRGDRATIRFEGYGMAQVLEHLGAPRAVRVAVDGFLRLTMPGKAGQRLEGPDYAAREAARLNVVKRWSEERKGAE